MASAVSVTRPAPAEAVRRARARGGPARRWSCRSAPSPRARPWGTLQWPRPVHPRQAEKPGPGANAGAELTLRPGLADRRVWKGNVDFWDSAHYQCSENEAGFLSFLCVCISSFFLLLGHTTIHLLMAICVVSRFWLLQIKLFGVRVFRVPHTAHHSSCYNMQ